MKGLLHAGRALLLDMAATLFFLLLYGLTGNITLSVTLGMVLALGQIGWQMARHRPVDVLQWISLFLVAASGAATLMTHDPVFVMLKPSVIYGVVGAAMQIAVGSTAICRRSRWRRCPTWRLPSAMSGRG